MISLCFSQNIIYSYVETTGWCLGCNQGFKSELTAINTVVAVALAQSGMKSCTYLYTKDKDMKY